MVDDNPIDDFDNLELSFQGYTEALADRLLDTNARIPVNILIDGNYGSGKTSLMKCVKNRIDDRVRGLYRRQEQCASYVNNGCHIINERLCKTFWFNPSEHQHMEDIARVFCYYLVKDITRNSAELSCLLKQKKLLASAFNSLEVNLGIQPQSVLLNIKKFLGAKNTAMYPSIELFLNDIQVILSSYLSCGGGICAEKEINKKNCLVVFIDDLDQCREDRVAPILQAFKVLKDSMINSCCFVFGLNYRTISDVKTDNDDGIGLVDVRNMIDKMFQVHFKIPTPNEADFQAWLGHICKNIDAFNNNDSLISDVVEILLPCANLNPRLGKKLLNDLLLMTRTFIRGAIFREQDYDVLIRKYAIWMRFSREIITDETSVFPNDIRSVRSVIDRRYGHYISKTGLSFCTNEVEELMRFDFSNRALS